MMMNEDSAAVTSTMITEVPHKTSDADTMMLKSPPPPVSDSNSVKTKDSTTSSSGKSKNKAGTDRDNGSASKEKLTVPASSSPPRSGGKLRRVLARRTFFSGDNTLIVVQGNTKTIVPRPPSQLQRPPAQQSVPPPGAAAATAAAAAGASVSTSASPSSSSKKKTKKNKTKKRKAAPSTDKKGRPQSSSNKRSRHAFSKPNGDDVVVSGGTIVRPEQLGPEYKGNAMAWEWIEEHAREYEEAPRTSKLAIAMQLIRAVQPGRWMGLVTDGFYQSLSDETALTIVCRALHPPGSGPHQTGNPESSTTPPNSNTGYHHKVTPAGKKNSVHAADVDAMLKTISSIKGPPRTEDQSAKIVKGTPHPHDVLAGKGSHIALHPGNLFFRNLVWDHKEEYFKSSRSEKQHVAQKVIAFIRERDPPGRYLEAVGDHKKAKNGWQDANGQKVYDKTCQALREKKWKHSTKDFVETIVSRPNFHPNAVIRDIQAGVEKEKMTINDSSEVEAVPKSAATPTPPKREKLPEASHLAKINAGSIISVYWPLDEIYYSAKVEERMGDRVLVQYKTDGVKEWINLSEHKIKFDTA